VAGFTKPTKLVRDCKSQMASTRASSSVAKVLKCADLQTQSAHFSNDQISLPGAAKSTTSWQG